MKIITAPHVHVLAFPYFIPHPAYQLPEYETPSEALTAHAGKGCYDSYGVDGRSIGEHISALIESKHGSVLEHANFTVFITGISRGLSHEFVRHRAGFAFSQRSTRYTKEEDASIVLSPYMTALWERGFEKLDSMEKALMDNFLNGCTQSIDRYVKCIDCLIDLNPEQMRGQDLRKWARGQARQLLPHALETRMTVTGNLRAWRHFFEQRSSRWAEDEIRRLAESIYRAIAPYAGMILADYAETNVRGIAEFTTENTKV